MKPEARVFEIISPTKKISRNYHYNKFSEFKYVFFETWNVNLSPTCCLLVCDIISFAFNATLLPLTVCDFCASTLLGNADGRVQKWAAGIFEVSAILGPKCLNKVETELKDKVANNEGEFNLKKRIALSVLGTLITVLLHSMSAVNKLNLL